MKKSNEQSIGEVLQHFLKENQLDKKIHQTEIIGKWEIIVGRLFSKHTKHLYFSGTRLFIELDSPALRNELLMQKSKLIEKINEISEEIVVTEIVIQ